MLRTVDIRPTAPTPPYRQLAAQLRDRIDAGEFDSEVPLPSETTIQQETGLARTTIRRAIRLLADQGVVYTVPGRGTYVRPDYQPGESPENT